MPVDTAMTAAVTTAHGGPEVIEVRTDWPRPAPGPGEALVRVRAAALNNTDIWSREGSYGSGTDPDVTAGWKGVPLEFPLIQGIDICGEVVEVGSGSDGAWIGRRVMVDPAVRYDDGLPTAVVGSEVDGGFARYHRCEVSQLRDVSSSPLGDQQLACLPCAYGTALGMLNRAECAPGERVLVTGSSGGVGMAAIQLLVHRGCEVVARTSAAHRDAVASLGAAEVSVRGVDDLTSIEEVDVVADVVGGEEFGGLLDRLRNAGRLVTAGAVAGPVVPLDLRRLYLRQRRLIGSTMHRPADFDELAAIANAGGVSPVVAATHPLEEIGAAQAAFLGRGFLGKIVLCP